MKKRFDQMIVKMIRIWERNGINKINKKNGRVSWDVRERGGWLK